VADAGRGRSGRSRGERDDSAAAAAREAGYGCIKVKVGLGDDGGRLAAVRAAAGPDMAIRVDANGAWSVEEAVAALRAFEPVGIELCEQPSADADSCEEVAAESPIPIALDESAPDALDRRVCHAVCLKIARFGGISGVVFAAGRARQAGYQVYLASMLDGPLGIATALHAAAVVKPDYACGLATLGLFDRPDPLPPFSGRIAIPSGPGLGDGLVDWYRD
jgi:L-alanine-DL-glutamate epimerase-like enolase superfamily enzyme